jgi:hypothetical protein
MSKTNWPASMKDEPGETGSALRQYDREPVEIPSEAAAYSRVLAKLDHSSTRSRWLLAMGTMALAVPLGLWLLRSGKSTIPSPTSSSSSSGTMANVTPTTPPPIAELERSVRLGTVPTTLPNGQIHLAGGVTATLADGTSATARVQEGTLDIALAGGTINLQVQRRQIGQALLITAGPYRFTVVGTVFRISHTARRLDLQVNEGLVAVSSGGDHVATVASGENWSINLPTTNPRRTDVVYRVARLTSQQDCTRFTAAETQQKIVCYREQVRKGGTEGERAQHALARYLRDDMADLTGALAAFESQRSRFPRGALRVDADRAVIELLPRLGRHAEALVETQSFLDSHPDTDDRAEIRLLRGDIYRAIFQDMMSAEREYDEGAVADGRTGDDSRFLRALCLEALGRVEEARLAYRDYLAQSGTAHTREAQRRMERLAR